jgi:hypothetical protein
MSSLSVSSSKHLIMRDLAAAYSDSGVKTLKNLDLFLDVLLLF